MGETVEALCLDCGDTFEESYGCGFDFEILRCNACGKKIWMDRKLGGDLWHSDYNKKLEVIAGTCECSGAFLVDAPARCPKCKSTNIKNGELIDLYD